MYAAPMQAASAVASREGKLSQGTTSSVLLHVVHDRGLHMGACCQSCMLMWCAAAYPAVCYDAQETDVWLLVVLYYAGCTCSPGTWVCLLASSGARLVYRHASRATCEQQHLVRVSD